MIEFRISFVFDAGLLHATASECRYCALPAHLPARVFDQRGNPMIQKLTSDERIRQLAGLNGWQAVADRDAKANGVTERDIELASFIDRITV